MISIKKLTSTALATIMLAGGIAIAPIITDSAAPEAQAASCTVEYRFAASGYSKAITCSASQYFERIGSSNIYAKKQPKGVRSQFSVCYANYKWSGMNIWY